MLAAGIWAEAAPRSFARLVAFPYHEHFLPDLGAFQVGIGVTLLVALVWRDAATVAMDGKRSPGHLSRQGPEVLRWALFGAAKAAARPNSPDYAYYQQVKARQGGNRATLAAVA